MKKNIIRAIMVTVPLLLINVACENNAPDRARSGRPYNAQKGQFEDPQAGHKTSPGDATR